MLINVHVHFMTISDATFLLDYSIFLTIVEKYITLHLRYEHD
jgi:hypothetical protein